MIVSTVLVVFGWMVGGRIGWWAMDRLIAWMNERRDRRRSEPITADYYVVTSPPKGGLFVSEK